LTLDLTWVRKQFPALDEAQLDGWALLDSAGGSQILGRVIDRIAGYYRTSNVQLGGLYPQSELAAERVSAATAQLARHFGARSPGEVVLGSSSTQLLANLATAMAPRLQPGDELVVTDCDHESNIGPWRRLEARGVVVKEWKLDRESFTLRAEELEPLLGKRTRLVCFTHVSNLLGAVHPVAELTKLVHAHGAQVCVDGVAYAPHRPLDVAAWDVDYYVFSLYKVFGPHQAALYGKRERLLPLDKLNHEFIGDDELPYKLQPGGVNYELVHGLGGIFEYLGEVSPALVRAHEDQLAGRLVQYLRGRRGVRLVGRGEVPTVSFIADGRRAADVVTQVARRKVAIKHGHFYAKRLCDALGLDGVLRASMVHYNTLAEVDRLIAALDEVL
jgi:cysteine desulfurase family protein (TIGR01976 family)